MIVNGMHTDKYQNRIIKSKVKNMLVLAGAGSGKTLIIVGKIKYLISKGIFPEEILCISYTKAASKSLESKLKKESINIKVKTFHSLGFDIIKKYNPFEVSNGKILSESIDYSLNKCKFIKKILNVRFTRLGGYDKDFNKLEENIIKNSYYLNRLKKIMIMFINLYKSGNYSKNDFISFRKRNQQENLYSEYKRHELFLNLMEKTINIYNNKLKKNKMIDYHDMINNAIHIIEKKGSFPYKYIIVDEYQDSSLNKLKLIKALQNKTNANFMAVGDDFQSIYSFTGSNLDIFINFKKYFRKSKIYKLKYTYRNPKELLYLTNSFICKNPLQIKKKIKSLKSVKYPIKIYYYDKDIKEIFNKLNDIKGKVFVLGRNNSDIKLMPFHSKNFFTIHKSKGLECDNTIIVNLIDNYNSIPNKIKDSEYLKYVKPQIDRYIYAEERRLFYVALTRCKYCNYLIVNKNNPSIFIKELIRDYSKYIKIYDIS